MEVNTEAAVRHYISVLAAQKRFYEKKHQERLEAGLIKPPGRPPKDAKETPERTDAAYLALKEMQERQREAQKRYYKKKRQEQLDAGLAKPIGRPRKVKTDVAVNPI